MRVVLTALASAVVVALYVAIIYAFFAYLWPAFPPWLAMIAFVALAVFAIGSPIFWLFRIAERVRREREAAQGKDVDGNERE